MENTDLEAPSDLRPKDSLAFPVSGYEHKSIPRVKVQCYDSITHIVQTLTEAFDQEGDIVQLCGFPKRVFCFRRPEHVRQIFTDPVVGQSKYPKMMPKVKSVMGTGAYIQQGGPAWRVRRKAVQPAFTSEKVGEYTSKANEPLQAMLDRWETLANSRESVHVQDEMRRLILEINFKVFFSAEPPAELWQIDEATHSLEEAFGTILPLWIPTGANRQFKKNKATIRNCVRDIVQKRRRWPHDSDEDLIDILLASDSQSAELTWNDEEIVDEMMSIYFGASVMSTTLTWGIFLMATHPEAQEKLCREVLQEDRPLTSSGQPLYSLMLLNEITRLYPPSWGYPRHAEKRMNIDGYAIPANSLVIPMVYHTHRHPGLWDQPEEFRPSRFEQGECEGRHTFAHYPFGGGQRMCTGAKLGSSVIQLVLEEIYRRFRTQFQYPKPNPVFGFEMVPDYPVMVSLSKQVSSI